MDRIAKGFSADEIAAIAAWYAVQKTRGRDDRARAAARSPDAGGERGRRRRLPLPALAQGAGARVVVVGGGFAGATCARTLKRLDPRLAVTMVEANPTRVFIACPFSNEVIVGLRELDEQQFRYDKLASEGIALNFSGAKSVDPQTRTVTLGDTAKLAYDRLVLAPGIDFRWDALPGYSEAAAENDAACLEGRAANLVAAPSARGDGATAALSSLPCRPTPIAARPAPTNGRA